MPNTDTDIYNMDVYNILVFSRKKHLQDTPASSKTAGQSRKQIWKFLPQSLPQIALPLAGFYHGYKHFDTFTSRPRTSQYQISAKKVNNSSYKPPTVSETVSRSFAPAMIRTTGAWFIRPVFLIFPKYLKKKNQNFMNLIIFSQLAFTACISKRSQKRKLKNNFFFFKFNFDFFIILIGT